MSNNEEFLYISLYSDKVIQIISLSITIRSYINFIRIIIALLEILSYILSFLIGILWFIFKNDKILWKIIIFIPQFFSFLKNKFLYKRYKAAAKLSKDLDNLVIKINNQIFSIRMYKVPLNDLKKKLEKLEKDTHKVIISSFPDGVPELKLFRYIVQEEIIDTLTKKYNFSKRLE